MYLGTEPPKQTVVYSEAKPLDYKAMEQERLALLSKLKAAGGAAGLDAAAAAKAEAKAGSNEAPLLLKAKVPSRLDSTDSSISISGGFGAGLGGGIGQPGGRQQQLSVVLQLANSTTAALQDVSLSVLAPAPVEAVDAQLSMPQLAAARRGSAATPVQLVLQQPGSSADSPAYLPSSNVAQVCAAAAEAQVIHRCLSLVLLHACQQAGPKQHTSYCTLLLRSLLTPGGVGTRRWWSLTSRLTASLVQSSSAYTCPCAYSAR